MEHAIPENIHNFTRWLSHNGGVLHSDVLFRAGPSGYSVIAARDIPSDTTVVSCPFDLAITPEVSRVALVSILGLTDPYPHNAWSERQLICSYLCLHWILGEVSDQNVLAHWPYLSTLPSANKLCTPLHFTPIELEGFRGSNLYGATLDRQRDWTQEWTQCRRLLSTTSPAWADDFTWELYLTAATYLSSRAFPSTLLSPEPSLSPTASSHPVLLPGIDALNHARAHPVSWLVSSASSPHHPDGEHAPAISLVLRTSTPSGHELFNNYGPKPNAELILGYGFSLPDNPDDTIVLKIGGSSPSGLDTTQQTYEVGRDAKGAEPVWTAVLAAICEDPAESTVEDELDAGEMLAEMAEDLRNRLPQPRTAGQDFRSEVATMLEHYVEGQRDILQSLMAFAQEKERQAIERARDEGLQIVDEEAEEE